MAQGDLGRPTIPGAESLEETVLLCVWLGVMKRPPVFKKLIMTPIFLKFYFFLYLLMGGEGGKGTLICCPTYSCIH